MHEYTQNAMTYVRNYGRTDLFITFIWNSDTTDRRTETILSAWFDKSFSPEAHTVRVPEIHFKISHLQSSPMLDVHYWVAEKRFASYTCFGVAQKQDYVKWCW